MRLQKLFSESSRNRKKRNKIGPCQYQWKLLTLKASETSFTKMPLKGTLDNTENSFLSQTALS